MRILIIKTGYCETFRPDLTYSSVSFGDILRTTPILHLFKNDEIHWLTDIKAVPLLYGLKEIHKIHLVNTLDVLGLETYDWNIIINLENSKGSCLLVSNLMKSSTTLYGFYLDKNKNILISSPYKGKNWSDKLFSLLGKKWSGERVIIPHKKISPTKKLIFLNRSVGPKLPEKRWDRWDDLEEKLKSHGFKTVSQKSQNIEDFIKEIQKSEFIISTDSLGIHIAIALKKPVLGLFGPSKASEVAGLNNFIQKNLIVLTSAEVFNKFKKIYNSHYKNKLS